MRYRSAIFDMDGTILESSSDDLSWLYDAVRESLSEHGNETDLSDSELEVLAGLNSKREFVEKCNSLDVEPKELWATVCEKRAVKKLEFIRDGGIGLCTGTEELLDFLNEEGVRTALISNSPDLSVDAIIRHFDIDDYFHYYRGVTSLEDLGKEKPDSWHIDIAVEELKRGPFVYIGDSKEDVQAAENTGIDSIKLEENDSLIDLKSRIV